MIRRKSLILDKSQSKGGIEMNMRKVRYWIAGGLAMLAPVALINLLCSLGVVEYLPWLAGTSGPAM